MNPIKAKQAIEAKMDHWLRLAALTVAFALGMMLALNGGSPPLEESLRNMRDGFHESPASGQIVVAEMDAKSLQRFNAWPWPRHYHAVLLDKLQQAGVSTVAFDIDLSSPSTPAEDAALAAALARFDGTVILPTFRQASAADARSKLENLPIPSFQEHAFLGSVNVMPDPDGVMRNYSYGVVTNNVPRPSLGALLASKPGQVGADFRIDNSIDPATIPRISFADIVEGKVAPGQLTGKTVLVGATAIEMGDRYATSRHGVIPGVFIQAMGAETLIKGSMNPSFGPWPMLALVLTIGFAIARSRQVRWRTVLLIGATISPLGLALGFESRHWGSLDIVPALVTSLVLVAGLAMVSIGQSLRRSRLFDEGTGLENGRALEQALDRHAQAGVMVVQFRNFGQTVSVLDANDREQLAARLMDRLQLGRFASDMYALQMGVFAWWTDAETLENQIEQADAIAALFASPIALGGRSILLTPAFGMAERRALAPSSLIAAATLSAASAAESGKRWLIHSNEMATATDRNVKLLADLETALAEKQIWVAYQPKWAIDEGRVLGAEALVRWRHPILGPIAPDEFIPLLEQEGRLHQLTMFVVDQCLIDLTAWQACGHDLGVAINISAPLLNDATFVEALAKKARDCELRPHSLTLEVTESAAITDSGPVIAALETLRATGARVSIDDYGTGQSTLTYLKSFPADEIKIDKSFVSRMADSMGDQVLVRSTIALAHDLGFEVVAEGVEDAACLAKLAEFGCDIAQGWHIGKPMAEEDFSRFLVQTPLAQAA